MDIQQRYAAVSIKTADNLKSIAQSEAMRRLSTLSLPEIEAVVELVGRVIPAGNVPGVILNGLARLPGRKPPAHTLKRDINLLFTGIEQSLDRAVYSTFFAGPAAVIWGYQNLLKLAGKDPDDSFPEGLWQFYVDYALREDTARHANETHGFDTLLKQHQIRLSTTDRVTAWVMAAIHCLHQYDALLRNEWRERVYTRLLSELTAGGPPHLARFAGLYRAWEKQRPYGRGPDAARQTYPDYRQARFDRFLAEAMRDLPNGLRQEWVKQASAAKERDLPAYQRQMSILAYLDAGPYGETRTPISLPEAHVGVICREHYYLIPACQPGQAGADRPAPADMATVRSQVAALLRARPGTPPAHLTTLARIRRAAWPDLRHKMDPALVAELDKLRRAPILFNCGPCARRSPLAELRQAERGVGDQALTLFDTGETIVFDQSHIFFDGAWGAALAEIMTQEALSWAVYLSTLPAAEPAPARPTLLALCWQPPQPEFVRRAPQATPEAAAETDAADLKPILRLRKLFKRRNDLLELTVNDLLLLYRAVHAVVYRPAPDLVKALKGLANRKVAAAALEAIEATRQVNPPVVIPVDASQRSPRDRLYPMTFEVPLADLDLLALHQRTMAALDAYETSSVDRDARFAEFDQLQRTYLAALAGFGAVLGKVKEIAIAGESASTGAIKLLAHMPAPVQRILDRVPTRFDLLNDIIKGREVFSNVGAVAPTSTLTRFITAKDDNDKKTLAWGVITDAQGVMRISLRDFRPHVGLLAGIGHKDLANRMAHDYLEAYARGLNGFIDDLQRITKASRETHLAKPETLQ
jgi:hypothetical protein